MPFKIIPILLAVTMLAHSAQNPDPPLRVKLTLEAPNDTLQACFRREIRSRNVLLVESAPDLVVVMICVPYQTPSNPLLMYSAAFAVMRPIRSLGVKASEEAVLFDLIGSHILFVERLESDARKLVDALDTAALEPLRQQRQSAFDSKAGITPKEIPKTP